jgi:hypothetical protein
MPGAAAGRTSVPDGRVVLTVTGTGVSAAGSGWPFPRAAVLAA